MIDVEIPLTNLQREIAADPHPIKIFIGGRRVGKSYLMKAILTEAGLAAPGRSCVIMPVQANANDFFTEMYTDSEVEGIEMLDEERDYTYDEFLCAKPKMWPFPRMIFKGTRHRLDFRSFENPIRLRGGNWTGVVVSDEANNIKGDELTQVVMPKILDTSGQLIITSSITHHNWLWDLYLRGQGQDRMVKSWLITTPEGPSFQGAVGKQRLADFKSLFPQWQWDAEMLCIPGTDNTAIFPYLDQCLTSEAPPERPQPGRRYIGGLDLGRVHDPEELIIIDDEGQTVLHESFELGLTHEMMAQRVAARSRFWRAPIVADATGAGGSGGSRSGEDSHILTYKAALADGMLIPMFWSANADSRTKRDVISHLSLMTEQGKIRINRDKFPKLIAQLRRYKILMKGGRAMGFGVTDGHDDCVAALAQAHWGIKQHWITEDGGLPISYA